MSLYSLALDVGGSNPRISMIDNALRIVDVWKLDLNNFSLIDQINNFLKEMGKRGMTTDTCCIAVAGKIVDGKKCNLTNINCTVSVDEIVANSYLKYVYLINDFEAIANAISVLSGDSGEVICVRHGKGIGSVRGIVGPGTGLGVAYIKHLKTGTIVLPSEGGHSPVTYYPGLEKLFSFVANKMNVTTINTESFVSGTGIKNIANFFFENGTEGFENFINISGEQVSNDLILTRAKRCDLAEAVSENYEVNFSCNAAINIFSTLLGSFCQSVSLQGLTSGGIFLAGGVLPKNKYIFDKKYFFDAFLDVTRDSQREFVSDIPIYLVTDYNVSLYGCGVYLRGVNEIV